jgi:hypothetical protein
MRAGGSRNAQAALVARAHYAPVTPAWPGLIHASSMTVSRAGAEGLTARSWHADCGLQALGLLEAIVRVPLDEIDVVMPVEGGERWGSRYASVAVAGKRARHWPSAVGRY